MNSVHETGPYQKCKPEDDNEDWMPAVSLHPESYGRKDGIPDYLREAAAKAGKAYNPLTCIFEDAPKV